MWISVTFDSEYFILWKIGSPPRREGTDGRLHRLGDSPSVAGFVWFNLNTDLWWALFLSKSWWFSERQKEPDRSEELKQRNCISFLLNPLSIRSPEGDDEVKSEDFLYVRLSAFCWGVSTSVMSGWYVEWNELIWLWVWCGELRSVCIIGSFSLGGWVGTDGPVEARSVFLIKLGVYAHCCGLFVSLEK